MENNAEQSAFPVIGSNVNDIREVEVKESGLTKRELLAAMAMQGLLANPALITEKVAREINIEETALIFADALLSQLQSKP